LGHDRRQLRVWEAGRPADLAAWTAANYPQSTSVEVNTGAYHHAGATCTQDLVFAAATGVEYLRAMTGAGLAVDTAIRQVVFGLSVGYRFFQAIAKLRALRKMWAKVVTTVGGNAAAAPATRIQARASRRVLTRRDPWVSLLRNTVCCFAGAVGGADAITTAPLDAAIGLSDEFSRHLARNTRIILLEESHLNRVIDHAGGSWFLERLTDQLAERAWALFQATEGRGGMIRAATEGWVAKQIRSVEATRARNLATRKQAVTGVSDHPNVSEQPVTGPQPDRVKLRAGASARQVAWRRDHPCVGALAALAQVAAAPARAPGALTEAAVKAAEAGATLGQISAALASGLRRGRPRTPPPRRRPGTGRVRTEVVSLQEAPRWEDLPSANGEGWLEAVAPSPGGPIPGGPGASGPPAEAAANGRWNVVPGVPGGRPARPLRWRGWPRSTPPGSGGRCGSVRARSRSSPDFILLDGRGTHRSRCP
jgi:methylmalonyl-CoA mutase